MDVVTPAPPTGPLAPRLQPDSDLVVAARDLLARREDWDEQKELEEFAKQLKTLGIPIFYDDIPITRQNAVAIHLILRAVRRGRVGFTLMASGFVFLLIYRACELIEAFR